MQPRKRKDANWYVFYSMVAASTCTDLVPDVTLPPPSAGNFLSHVVVGRGTQNYTCASSTAAHTPVAAGAVATLFNTTCIAGMAPALLKAIPQIALRFPIPTSEGAQATDRLTAGHHWFSNLTTPFFKLDTEAHTWGSVWVKKGAAGDAPNKAKDIPWLKLLAVDKAGCSISEVYRLNTAGGLAPTNCEGQKPNFEVQYAAEYWFYSAPPSY